MKKNISIKSWQSNFRERYPGLRRAVMIQRAMQAIRLHYWHKIAPERAVKFLPLKNPLGSIYHHYCGVNTLVKICDALDIKLTFE